MDTESHPEPEPRSAGSIVADLIQDMNAANQPAPAEPEPETQPEPEATDEARGLAAAEPEVAPESPTVDAADESAVEAADVPAGEDLAADEPEPEATLEPSTVDAADESAVEAADELAGGELASDGLVAGEPEALIELEVDPGAIEAILLVVDEPLTAITLATVLDRPERRVTEALRGLAMAYDAEQRGFDLREVAGGWRLYTREEYAEVVEKFVLDGQQAKLTQASLETLAVVAYRQPVSRSRVSAIRGVNCDGVMRTLIARGLIEEAGLEGESGATLYRTTSYFLERLGLNSLDELPDLAPYLPEMDEIEDAIHAESALQPPAADESEAQEPDDQ